MKISLFGGTFRQLWTQTAAGHVDIECKKNPKRGGSHGTEFVYVSSHWSEENLHSPKFCTSTTATGSLSSYSYYSSPLFLLTILLGGLLRQAKYYGRCRSQKQPQASQGRGFVHISCLGSRLVYHLSSAFFYNHIILI